MSPRNVAVLGCTGSIGTAALEVIDALGGDYRVYALSAHRQHEQLAAAAQRYGAIAALTDAHAAECCDWLQSGGPDDRRLCGPDSLPQLASDPAVDIVVAAVVGAAGLASAMAAAQAGKRLALANKEALVVAGSLLTRLAADHGAQLLPVDSEHSAIFQAIADNQHSQVQRLVLTASGGSLRDWPIPQLADATPGDALKHPTWAMGAKITIDSATMMNKALEVIEARWLFGVPADRISVVVHPQSIIHSMVEFVDGSVMAQLSPPDMKLPIQYALTYPDRRAGPSRRFDWSQNVQLTWSPADLARYPALELGFRVARDGGTAGAVLNAANEVAVQRFLDGEIRFTDIVACVEAVLDHHDFDATADLAGLLSQDVRARQEAAAWRP